MSLSLSYSQSHAYPTSTPNIVTEFGIRLRDLRHERKLSEVDMAWQVGITRAHLQDIEEGREEIDLDMLWTISGVLGISMASAVEGL